MTRKGKTRVAVIGIGRFGARRAAAAAANPRSAVVVVADVRPAHARDVAERLGCAYATDWRQGVTREDVDAVIVSTPTRLLPEVSRAALDAGKHVLVEKPFGRNADEVVPAVEAARRNHRRLKVGYNHRYHPAVRKAWELFQEGTIGRSIFLRCCYGHGGRPGYEQEWRSQIHLSGGGELLDQGVHALDLFQWFAGEFREVTAYLTTAFWPIEPAEDNAFVLLRTPAGCVAQLHASWTNWKNTFSFEVSGEKGYLAVSGLGGNYGPEQLCCGVRPALGAKPEERCWDFPEEDRSLALEWDDFLKSIAEDCEPQSNGQEGWRTLQLVEAIYRAARAGRSVCVDAGRHAGERALQTTR